MRTKFTSAELPHIWANQSAPYGESPSAMSFNSDGFYSYGTIIARHIEHKGKPAIILNDTSYSVSTSRHQQCVRQAIRGSTIFHIGDMRMGTELLDVKGPELFEYAIKRATEFQEKAKRARSNKEYLEGQVVHWLQKAKEINEFFGLKRKVDEKTIERLADAKARADKKEKLRHEKEAADRMAKQQEAFEQWKNGNGYNWFDAHIFPTVFRVEGDELVSSMGARIPLPEAKKAFRFVNLMRNKGWRRNGDTFTVGPYQLDSVSEVGIIAGCHRILWDEVQRLTPILQES